MIHEVSPEKARAHLIESLNFFVLNYADLKKFAEIMENKPMVEKERMMYDRSVWSLTDKLYFERILFNNAFGEEIGTAIDKSFMDMYEEGKLQSNRESARRMKNKGYAIKEIAEITNLTSEEIEGLY